MTDAIQAWIACEGVRAGRARQALMWLTRLARAEATLADALRADRDWSVWGGPAQQAPAGEWRAWLFMGGRGAGKTRAGAEWVRALVESGAARRIALVGPTLGDVREVMIEGPSGLRSIGGDRPVYNATRRRLVWRRHGAVAYAFSAEDPDSLRGPQFDAAWCDEIGAWKRDVDTWDNLMFGMRLGEQPRTTATTTPRAKPLVKRLAEMADADKGGVKITRAGTMANARNLSPGFVEDVLDLYGGTTLGRQEIEGELIEYGEGALFLKEWIEEGRVAPEDAGPFDRVVVAVDPPASLGAKAAACGIIAAGLRGGLVYVLGDATAHRVRPKQWATAAVELARRVGAGEIVAEGNQGGEMVREMLQQAGGAEFRVKVVHASRSKLDRTAPVAGQYELRRVRHAGVFTALEDELFAFGTEAQGRVDRVDALVWAVSDLLGKKMTPPKLDTL